MVLNPISSICNCVSSSVQSDQSNLENPSLSEQHSTKQESLEHYDPHEYGKQQHPTLFWGSLFHLFKTIIGTGMLALPFAFKNVGYGVAVFGIFLVGFIYLHVLHLLMDVEYQLCKKLKRPNLTYLGIVTNTFEQGPGFVRKITPIAKSLLYFHYVFNKSISNSIYLITIGGNLKIIIDHYYNVDLNIVFLITAVTIMLIPMALIRSLKFLVPLSILTSVFNMINIVLILTIPTDYNSSADFRAVGDITKFPYFFGLALGAFNCTAIVMPLKNDMKYPKKFTSVFGIINIVLPVVAVIYCTFGLLGYAKYGNSLHGSILFNLPPDQLVSFVVLSLYSFAVCISFILTLYTVFDTLWSNIFKDQKMSHPITAEYALRIFLCIAPYCIAIILPDFKIMVSLAGVIAILMDETVPIILHALSLIQKKPKTISVYLSLMKDLTLISICSLLFSAALIEVIRSIVKFYS
ncbi:proton-coupled amino acid transporter-like protein pathetic [Planococcus citri]|uniref:proton-coupled amino acid transporter-like protein pathetic n=1 Tax=Planococcus citri TaxID=170843 RepID=UPI0031F9CF28